MVKAFSITNYYSLIFIVRVRLHNRMLYTVVAKRIRTFGYFIKKWTNASETVKQITKHVTMYLKYNMHSCYCGFLTLPSFFENLGMLSGRFYTSQTLDILPKMPLICCCKTGNDKAWHHILWFHSIVFSDKSTAFISLYQSFHYFFMTNITN